ncbi:hypothetical protein P3T76_006908 [Phytophthora citrophthora]|uniref:Uncharacterized protein n=1 Tax=Phytophthora citrophthora TaxID=4793 RepID=A0AAD9LP87_9STRA|nr:hypothetical protein P3T76_006908 [Phytophthora citrophthora]
MPPTAFRVQLVMEDATGNRKRLKHSKRHGQLVLDANDQSVQLTYPRVGQLFKRKFEQPQKCVIGRKLLRVYSSNGRRSFTCRLLSEEDAASCYETFRSFGVEVIGVGESMLTTIEPSISTLRAAVLAGGEAALQAIRAASPRSMQAEIREYKESAQFQDDKDDILRAMFNVGP